MSKFCSLALAVVVSSTGCVWMLPAPTPLPALRYPRDGEPGRCVMLMLPGRGDSGADFAAKGFIAAARERSVPVDLVALDATIGYYAKRTLLERVRHDVVEPMRASGDQRPIWIAGVSMGGLGALLEARDLQQIDGVLLLAPFVGDDAILDEITAAGGPLSWKPGPTGDDYQRELWRWLQGPLSKPDEAPRIYLAFGESDRLAKGQRVLAQALPADRVFRREGAHDWNTWLALWRDFLDRSDFAARCAGR